MSLKTRLAKARRKVAVALVLSADAPSPETFDVVTRARRTLGFLLLARDKQRRPHIYAK